MELLTFVSILISLIVLVLVFMRTKPTENHKEEKLEMFLAELNGRLSQVGEQVQQQNKNIEERFDAFAGKMREGIDKSAAETTKNMSSLQERLAVIDSAQKKITNLSEQVVGLQDILSNKQARGAFGEVQLEDIVSAALPPSAYSFQTPLGGNYRVDCLLQVPNPPGPIAVDSKFPLEGYQNYINAEPAQKPALAKVFSASVLKHVKDIANKYIVPGETAESAIMFLPSEAVYAELHTHFRDVIESSYKMRVWIVSPSTLMATLNTVRAILRDVQMREQAGLIQHEVSKIMEDVHRLDTRVGNLQRHFGQAEEDIRKIRTSNEKIINRAEKIENLQLEDNIALEDINSPIKIEE